ncbi:hypothetical protein TWF694_003856 [Orbilia ellipsospora]|uniref:Uncharacterized protein n=1 Tax=Orbilia ellipsospora TaxID=2528407 RepID=A0AAV9X0P1_9PEZI
MESEDSLIHHEEEGSPPPYQSPPSYSPPGFSPLDEIHTYYYGGYTDEEGSIRLESHQPTPIDFRSLFSSRDPLPVLYICNMMATVFTYTRTVKRTDVSYFPIAVYNSIAAFVAMGSIFFNSFKSSKNEGSSDPSQHWKPFAFVLLYLLSEEGFWFSLKYLPTFSRYLTYVGYPFFLALVTWQWVFGGITGRIFWIKVEDQRNLQATAFIGLLAICWSFEPTFEWWSCIVATATRAFKDVIARDIMSSSNYMTSELVMLASSVLAFRSLALCYSSSEYDKVWPFLANMSANELALHVATGICYTFTQLTSLEMLRLGEPIKRYAVIISPALWGMILPRFVQLF